MRAHSQCITSSIHYSTTPSPLKMGENKKLPTYIVSLSGGRGTLVEHLVAGISTVAIGSDNAKSITSSTLLSSV